jgi:hypothetical protein
MLILDHYWWLVIPGILLGLYAQFRVHAAYNRYLQVPADRGLTGAQAAREILDEAGLHDMPINEVAGQLSDHYDPLKKALFLSSDNFHGRSLAALGVAAHEAGHALQHAAAYFPMQVRQTLVPVTQFASNAAVWIGMLGFVMSWGKIAGLAIIVFSIITLFQLVTLPVEFDASRRAKALLLRLGLIGNREREGVSRVLNAAALTYVAAMVSSLLTLLHFILIFRGSDRD